MEGFQIRDLNEAVTMIIMAVFVYHVFRGYRKGFIKQAAFVINTILALILAPVAMPIFWGILNELDVTSELEHYIDIFLQSYYYSHTASGVMLSPEITDHTLRGVDGVAMAILSQNAGIIAKNIIRTLSYSFGFVSVRIVLHFFLRVTDVIAALPIIHEFDKAIGALSGGLMTLLSVWIITSLMSLLTFIPGIGAVFDAVMEVPVIQAFRTINPFSLLVQAVDMMR